MIQKRKALSAFSVKRPDRLKPPRMRSKGGQEIAFTLLARRDYSREELARKLAARGIPREEMEGILRTLQDQKLLDDRRYARRWASVWIEGKLWGPLRIRMRLLQKGVPEEIVKEILRDTEESFPAKERLREIITAEGKKEENGPLPLYRQKRLMNLLRHRGYGWEDISEVLQESGGFAEE
jgi:regulatory protein